MFIDFNPIREIQLDILYKTLISMDNSKYCSYHVMHFMNNNNNDVLSIYQLFTTNCEVVNVVGAIVPNSSQIKLFGVTIDSKLYIL